MVSTKVISQQVGKSWKSQKSFYYDFQELQPDTETLPRVYNQSMDFFKELFV